MPAPAPAQATAALEAARESGLLGPGTAVTVLLSGGQDSVCLLDCAVTLGATVRALHVDYGLRAESALDAEHCAALCSRLHVSLEVVRPPRPEGPGNLQAWARDVRYSEALRRPGFVAAGHTASDQVEGVLYRLAASPGRRALLGMAPRSGRLIRPLLEVTRVDTAAHCEVRGLGWREDASNAQGAFARNRARRDLLPALRALHPAAEANVLRTLATLRDEAAVLDALVEQARTAPLAGQPPALARLVLQRLADEAGGGRAPAVGHRLEAVLALGSHGSKRLDLGGGLHAVAEYGMVRVERAGRALAVPDPPDPVELALPGVARFGAWTVRAEAAQTDVEADVLEVTGPLTVRGWHRGDRMRPRGGPGRRSLQDLFCDRKVPRAARAAHPVVCSPGGAVLWVPGVAIAEHVPDGPRMRLTAVPDSWSRP